MRLETGVFQPNGDWPGVFIRGDNALMYYLPAVKTAIAAMQGSKTTFQDALTVGALKRLAELLVVSQFEIC